MVVQRRHAHTRDVCEIFHSERLRIVRPDPRDHFRCAVALISYSGNRSQPLPFWTSEYPVNDLALNQRTEKGNVLRRVQQVDETTKCSEELRRSLSYRHRRSFG